MVESRFVYVTHIRTTAEKLWQALTDPQFTRRYWCDTRMESDWKPGSAWQATIPDGRAVMTGQVIESDPPHRLVVTWRHELNADMRAEGFSRVTYEIAKQGESVKLTIIQEMEQRDSKLIKGVSNGWPLILASLKSILETGEPLDETREWHECEASKPEVAAAGRV